MDEAKDAKVFNRKNAPRAVMLYGFLIMSVYLCSIWLHACEKQCCATEATIVNFYGQHQSCSHLPPSIILN